MKKLSIIAFGIISSSFSHAALNNVVSREVDNIQCKKIMSLASIVEQKQKSDVCKYIYRQHVIQRLNLGCSMIETNRGYAKGVFEDVSYLLSGVPQKNNCSAQSDSNFLRLSINELIKTL